MERERGGEVISPPEHIHFTVFSSTLPVDITSLPLQAIIPPFAIIYVAKSLHLHTYLPYLCTHTTERDCKLPAMTIRGSQRFPSAADCRYRVSAQSFDILLILLSIPIVKKWLRAWSHMGQGRRSNSFLWRWVNHLCRTWWNCWQRLVGRRYKQHGGERCTVNYALTSHEINLITLEMTTEF